MTPQVFKIWQHTTWGDNIFFSSVDDLEITGHIAEPIHKGDIIQSKMESGKIAAFKVVEIRFRTDPKDLFFGRVEFLNYVDEPTK